MMQAERLSESTKRPPFRWRAELLSRLSGPGGLYNLGDALGFGSGLLIAYLGWWESTSTADNVLSIGMRYVAGSPAAVALTLATAIFFGSGEAYHRAWANGFPPDTKLTQIGDLFSGFGAIALGVGLYLLGNPVLAATSGLLHAAGKFGSAFNTKGKLSIAGRNIDASVFCRIVVLISRAPALIAISADILSSRARDDCSFAFISLVMLACYLIWSVADLMLLTRDNVLKRLFRPSLAPKISA
jgi:hypothetical protein